MEKGKYITKAAPTSYISFETMKAGDGFRAEIHFVHPDGKTEYVADAGIYTLEGVAKRKATGLRLRYSGYYSRTGNRWEVIEREKREARQNEKRRLGLIESVVKNWEKLSPEDRKAAAQRMEGLNNAN